MTHLSRQKLGSNRTKGTGVSPCLRFTELQRTGTIISKQSKVSLRCSVPPHSSFAPFVMIRPTPRSLATDCWCALAISAVPPQADTHGSPLAGGSCARSKPLCETRWIRWELKKFTFRPCSPATFMNSLVAGKNTATISFV